MSLSHLVNILLLSLAFTSFAMGIDLPASLKPFYEKQGVEFGGLTEPDEGGEGAHFVEFVKENWQAIAQEFDTFAPSPRQQALVALAAEQLAPRTYLNFVELICDKIAAGKVSPDIINTFLLSKGPKHGFFDVNFSDPEVHALVTRFKQLTPLSDTGLHHVLDRIESGEAKTDFYAWQELEPSPPPEVLSTNNHASRGTGNEKFATPTPGATPAPSSPSMPVTQGPALPAEQQSPMWFWVIGILALVVIGTLVWKRRA